MGIIIVDQGEPLDLDVFKKYLMTNGIVDSGNGWIEGRNKKYNSLN